MTCFRRPTVGESQLHSFLVSRNTTHIHTDRQRVGGSCVGGFDEIATSNVVQVVTSFSVTPTSKKQRRIVPATVPKIRLPRTMTEPLLEKSRLGWSSCPQCQMQGCFHQFRLHAKNHCRKSSNRRWLWSTPRLQCLCCTLLLDGWIPSEFRPSTVLVHLEPPKSTNSVLVVSHRPGAVAVGPGESVGKRLVKNHPIINTRNATVETVQRNDHPYLSAQRRL